MANISESPRLLQYVNSSSYYSGTKVRGKIIRKRSGWHRGQPVQAAGWQGLSATAGDPVSDRKISSSAPAVPLCRRNSS
jgi:hypothetical protein